ncbi:MAG TPA: hypothetical protein VK009_07470 [Chloroflexota bacterium]|nr:hypothetical protein [Chloroflexota bacterium]
MISIFESGLAGAQPRVETPSRAKRSPAERLYRELEAHRDQQAAVVAETQKALSLSASPLSKFLLELVEDGSSRDLAVLDRMSASLRDALYWTYSPEALPEATADRERAAAVEAIRKVLQLERGRARSARRLAKTYSNIDGGLERALLEASAASAEANVKLLQLLLDRAARRDKQPAQVSTVWQPALKQRRLAATEEPAPSRRKAAA